jgi:DNA-binding XRE family transcriptional regulator
MPTNIGKYARRRDARGRLQPGVVASSAILEKDRQNRAREWKRFRADYLYSQTDLAGAIKCSRRTVCAVEAGECVPQARLQRRFRDLVRREKEAAA